MKRLNSLVAFLLLALVAPPLFSDETPSGGYSGGIRIIRAGTPFSITPTVNGIAPPYVFTYDPTVRYAGAPLNHMPAGLQLDSATGTVSGVPTEIGNFIIGVTLSGSTGPRAALALYVSIISGDLQIGLASLPAGAVGQPYSIWLPVIGGSPPYVWSVASGSLPPGLTLQAPPTNEFLKGVPTQGGSWTFTLQARDATGKTGSQQFTVIVTGIQITTSTVPEGRVGVQYEQQLTASGGTAPYRWSVVSGNLVPGITLSNTGILGGVPTTVGSFPLLVRATDSAGGVATASITLTVVAARLSFNTQSLPAAKVKEPWSASLTVSGGVPPFTFTLIGRLPTGLELRPSGLLTGTPQEPGDFNFTVLVRDSASQQAQQAFAIKVAPAPVELPLIESVVSAAGFQPFIAPGAWVTIFGTNLAPDSGQGRGWLPNEILDGALPFSLDGVNATIDGKPAAIAWAGPNQLNVQAPDDNIAGIVSVKVTNSRGSAESVAQLQGFAPELFVTKGSQGELWAVAAHADGSVVTPQLPAAPDEIITLYGSGFGLTDPPQPSGKLITPSKLKYPMWITVGGSNAEIRWAGLVAPGLNQFNFNVPVLPPGEHAVVLSISGFNTQRGVLLPIAVR